MPVQRELRQGSSARIAATEVASRDLLLPLEPNRHFMPRKIDVPIDAPAFGKAELLVVTPAPQGDGADAETLAEPRRNHKLCRWVAVTVPVVVVTAAPTHARLLEANAFNILFGLAPPFRKICASLKGRNTRFADLGSFRLSRLVHVPSRIDSTGNVRSHSMLRNAVVMFIKNKHTERILFQRKKA
jgi:hypothetical protein